MAQEELVGVTYNIKKAAVQAYVKAFCSYTGEPEPPVGEVTVPEFHKLLRAVMNTVSAKYEREHFIPVPPEANE